MLVDKDARERSDAAQEAFLAELALDAKKNAKSDMKQSQDKPKDKKKLKDLRRSKDFKVAFFGVKCSKLFVFRRRIFFPY